MSLRGEVILHGRRAAQFNGEGFSIYPLTAPLVWHEVFEAVQAASRFLADHPYTVLDFPALVFCTARSFNPGRGPTRWPPEAIAALRQPSLPAPTEDDAVDLPAHSDVDSPVQSEDEDAKDHARRRLESSAPAIPPPSRPFRRRPPQKHDKASRRLEAADQACQAARVKAFALAENTWERDLAEAYVRRAREALKVAVRNEALADRALRDAVEEPEGTRSSHRHSV
ncbi:hypothetical protein ONZ51_g13160 [Trametes cubensis]|uniref:Uncharacterized protein n=1 Tax=Trametes cubensis TaxID=1111947 RepID=A0AAD7TEV2_9APHY|nr:hypothetical protein ONZ51_g13160 [Trametes cubensis]